MRRTWTTAAILTTALAGAAAGLALGPALRLDAAKARASLDISLAPPVVEGRSEAQVFLSLRNAGSAAATLGAGDRFDISYMSGSDASALAYTGSQLVAPALPDGMIQQAILGDGSVQIGVRLFVQGTVTIDPGTTLLVPFDFVAGEKGVAPILADIKLGKAAGKYARKVEARIAKSAPRGDLFFGDGADGPLTITTTQALPPLGSWTDVTIETGAVVTVPAGTTIRCTGTFTNRGAIVVLTGTPGGGERIDAAEGTIDALKQYAPALFEVGRGDALSAASRPAAMEGAPSGQASSGGLGGRGLGAQVYQLPLSHYRVGGGGGSGAVGAIGGDGGGLLRVLARGALRNAGTISATGTSPAVNRTGVVGGGGGGGAGGIVILASATSVENDATTGVIDVRGAEGGHADQLGASGGGGGGGLVVFAAPQVGALGATLLGGGVTVVPAGTVTTPIWTGGGGGGACVGNGADGYGVSSAGVLNGNPGAHVESGVGQVLTFTADPRSIW